MIGSYSLSNATHVVLQDYPHHLTKYEGKGTKISIFKLFSDLGKIWKCNVCFSKTHLSYELETKFLIYEWIGKSYVLVG